MKILIADPDASRRKALSAALRAGGDVDPVAAADAGTAAELLAEAGEIALVAVDHALPGLDPAKPVASAIRLGGNVRVALTGAPRERVLVVRAVLMGAAGVLPADMPATSVAHALRYMAWGERLVPIDMLLSPSAQTRNLCVTLSSRESQVLGRLIEGKTNKAIALELDLSLATVKLHVKTLCRKLGAVNRTQAALAARDAGLA